MNMRSCLMCLMLLHLPRLMGTQDPVYTYPVARYKHIRDHLLILKQWSINQLELYDQDMATGIMTKVLMNMYIPAAVTVLPDQSGFSFIDNGRIRIKRFEKRAVKSLDIYAPIYGIEFIRWLDNETCYFHAKSDGHFGIYTLTLDQELTPLLAHEDSDYMYPCIQNSELFFVERKKNKEKYYYNIQSMSDIHSQYKKNVILDNGIKPIIMLHMTNTEEGFFIECEQPHNLYIFHYYQMVKKENSRWHCFKLFSFKVPPEILIDGPQRLYESLLPLVPRLSDHIVYFSSYDEEIGKLAIYSFSLKTKLIERIAGDKSGHLFVPLLVDKQMIIGGTLYPYEQPAFI